MERMIAWDSGSKTRGFNPAALMAKTYASAVVRGIATTKSEWSAGAWGLLITSKSKYTLLIGNGI